ETSEGTASAHAGTATDLSFQLAMAAYKADAPVVRDAPAIPALAPTAALDVSAGAVSALAPVIADGTLGSAPRKGVKPVKKAPLGPPATATTPGPDGLLLGGAYIESDDMRETK